MWKYAAAALLLPLLTGCLALPPHPEREPLLGPLLLEETFDNPAAWDRHNLDGVLMGVEDGLYRARVSAPLYAFALNRVQHDDLVLSVELRQLSGSRDAAYGLICRAGAGGAGRGYYFLISSRGSAIIYRNSAVFEPLVTAAFSPAIVQERGRNTLRVVCVQDYLALYVNDVFVVEARDSFFERGYTGLVAGSLVADGDLEVTFSRLYIWAGRLAPP